MDLTAIRDKYQKNLEKDATYKSFQKPKLRLIGDKKTFWESAVQKDEIQKPNFNIVKSGLKEKKDFWSNNVDSSGKPKSPKTIRTFQNKKVEDLTKTWQDIVQGSTRGQQNQTRKGRSFVAFYGSRINVAEMSDKYQESQLRESSNDKDIVIEDLEEKRQDKEQKWEETICKQSKDSNKTKDKTLEKETDVEQLCKVIYDNGEQYMDGTAAINFAALKIAFRGSGNLTHAITKAKKFGIIDHDGDEDEAYSLENDDVVVLLVPVFKVVEAFQEMRDKNSNSEAL